MLEEEYKALREEILKRIDLRQQLVLADVTISGVLWGIGVQGRYFPVFFLVPPITTFLAISWAHHDIRIKELGNYIKKHFEQQNKKPPYWEHYLERMPRPRVLGIPRRILFSHMGMFFTIEVMSIVLGIGFQFIRDFSFSFSVVSWVLISVDIASLFTLLLAAQRRPFTPITTAKVRKRNTNRVDEMSKSTKEKDGVQTMRNGEGAQFNKAPLESLMAFYQAQWSDIHHSRRQDWELIKLIVLGLIGASGFKFFEVSNTANLQQGLLKFFATGFLGLSLLGVFVTARHRILFREKMKVIVRLEHIMGVEGFFKASGGRVFKVFRKIFVVQHALVLVYLFMANLFLYFLYPNFARIVLYYLLIPIWLFYAWIEL